MPEAQEGGQLHHKEVPPCLYCVPGSQAQKHVGYSSALYDLMLPRQENTIADA